MKEIDKILNSLDEFAGYLVDENVGARYIDALSDLEAAIEKHESDSELLDWIDENKLLSDQDVRYDEDLNEYHFWNRNIPEWVNTHIFDIRNLIKYIKSVV